MNLESTHKRGRRLLVSGGVLLALVLVYGCSGSSGGNAQKPPYHLPPDPVECLAFSPKSGVLVAAANQKLRFWDLASGKELRSVEAHDSRITSLAVSADGERVATGCSDRSLKVWDARTGEELMSLSGHRAPVTALAFSPDGKLLASGAGDPNPFLGRNNAPETDNVRTELKLWDLQAGKHLANLNGHGSPISGLAFRADGQTLLSVALDGAIKLWSTADRKSLRSTEGRQPETKALALSPDGKTLALACHTTKAVRLWDVDSWKEKAVLSGHSDRVNAVAFSPDGGLLASAGDDETVIIWDLATGTPTATLKGHTQYVQAVTFGADSRIVAAGGIDAAVHVWDVGKAETLRSLK